jgi:molybdate transport system permease protein
MEYSADPILLSLRLSFITTLILFITGVPVAYWLSCSRSILKPIAETVLSLPLVLPPSVLGFYLLLAFSPGNFTGKFLEEYLGIKIVFSFGGLVAASVLYSLPFMIHPVQAAFQNLSPSLKEASYSLGISPLRTFLKVLLPNIKAALLTGVVLTFAHTMGEFGVVLMIGGNIPGLTKVASIAVYDEVESMNYTAAHFYSLILVGISFLILFTLFMINRRYKQQNRFW